MMDQRGGCCLKTDSTKMWGFIEKHGWLSPPAFPLEKKDDDRQ